MEDDQTQQEDTNGGEQQQLVFDSGEDREIDFSDIETPEELKAPAPVAKEPVAEPPAAVEVPALDRERAVRPPLVPKTVWIVLAAVVTALALGVAAYLVTSASSRVIVPNVTSVSEGEAVTRLAQAGLEADVTERRFSAEAQGTVLAQSPSEGTELKRGDTVGLVVSAGTEELTMPDVVGDGITLARGVLEEKGLVVTIEAVPSDAASDTVLATTPAAGAIVRTGDVVRVQVAAPLTSGEQIQPYRLTGLTFVIDAAPMPKGTGDVTLEVARRLRALLEASGAQVRSLRSGTSTATAATDRAKAAEGATATAAVGLSVSAKGRPGRTVMGPSPATPAGAGARTFVMSVANQLAVSVPPSAEVSATPDKVFGKVTYPWLRVGLGSLSDTADKASLSDPRWLDHLATALYTSIGEVFGTKEQ